MAECDLLGDSLITALDEFQMRHLAACSLDQKDEPKHRQEEYRIQELRVGLETICVAMRYPEYGTEAHS
jgi:hypothetical protein